MLTILSLSMGVALVVAITAVSSGLDSAQSKVLDPLASVGTDLLVTRPVATTDQSAPVDANPGGPPVDGGAGFGFGGRQAGGLSREDQQALLAENASVLTDLSKLGEPGDHFVHDFFLPATQLTFGDRRRVPDGGEEIQVDLNGTVYTIIGLAQPPLGGQVADVYVSLTDLQSLSSRSGRANVLLVRADKAADVASLTKSIEAAFPGATVTSAKNLAERISGSLVDAGNLAHRLGGVLATVVLIAAFLVTALLTLSSVTKRVRELGTLKAIGWRRSLVVRQVIGESVVQGLLGGLLGISLGVVVAAVAALRPGQPLRPRCRVGPGHPRRPAGRRRRRPASGPPPPRRRSASTRLTGTPAPDTTQSDRRHGMYKLEKLSKLYRQGSHTIRAVDGVDLVITEGDWVAIEGASGSGKSTLLQLLGGARPSR